MIQAGAVTKQPLYKTRACVTDEEHPRGDWATERLGRDHVPFCRNRINITAGPNQRWRIISTRSQILTTLGGTSNVTHMSYIWMRSLSTRRCTSTSTKSSCSGSWRSGWSPYTATTTPRASSVPLKTSITDTTSSTTGNKLGLVTAWTSKR